MPGGVASSIPLTPMQRRLMLALQARLAARPDIGATYEELREDLGLSSKSGVFRLVRECEERGRVERMPGTTRSVRVLVPVRDEDADVPTLLSSFSDVEILRETARRGLLQLKLTGTI